MVNESIRIGLANDLSSLRKLSQLSYNQLAQYDSPSCYKLCPISRAAGILAARKKSLRRRISHQRALYCQTAARIMLRLQDEERRIGDSDRERETSQHTPNQAHAKHDLSTTGRKYRGRMNGWSFSEAQRQLEYKARWTGLPVIRISRRGTRGSSMTCPRCGERLQSDKRLTRKLWCSSCRAVMDRDRVAAVNLAWRGRVRFDRSRAHEGPQGGAVEAVKGNPTPTVIPGVDAPKLTQPTKS
ncbi:IS200/IS605 family element transposase accessory protein TnpB [Candidatus Bathyarchaeota archaeon]|nr:MAG: IS200/IS605 family element transposase accessory protein TnpB [Candidatus Bathyarchaeota archaeon]